MKRILLSTLAIILTGFLGFAQNYPNYAIEDLKGVDSNGEPDSLGVTCTIKGIVHGKNLNNGFSFVIIDSTADGKEGFFIFNNSNLFNYTPTEGDMLEIKGEVGFFRGLTQLIKLDTIIVLSQGNNTYQPRTEQNVSEDTENDLIRINGVTYSGTETTWGSNKNYIVDKGSVSFTIRIDDKSDLIGENIPSDTFDVVGIGGQFDGSSPYDEGYQLLPHYKSQIIPKTTGGGSSNYISKIADITTVDANGEPDSMGLKVSVKGILLTDNTRSSGLKFTLEDATGGIGVFENSNNFGLTDLKEGDEIEITGTVGQFNGLTQLGSIESISRLSVGNSLPKPLAVTALNENTESELIVLKQVTLVNPITSWPTGSSAERTIEVTNGTQTFVVFIDNATNLPGEVVEAHDTLNIIGIGGQFDNSSPYSEGYQIIPRGTKDIEYLVGPELKVQFNASETTVNEGDGTISIPVSIANPNANPTTVTVTLDNSSTASSSDYSATLPINITFPASSSQDAIISINLTDDMEIEGNETIVLNLSNPTNGATLGTSIITITIEDNDFETESIIDVRANDSEGAPTRLGDKVQIEGIVHGVNFRPGGLQITVIDETAGIGTFSSIDFGYTANEGDKIRLIGTVAQFNGLTQLSPLDTVIFISANNALVEPTVVNLLGENTESNVVKIEKVWFTEPQTEWPSNGNVDLTNGTFVYAIRIDDQVELAGLAVPSYDTMTITGIGGQFDRNSPFDEGYQLFPRYAADIEEWKSPEDTSGSSVLTLNDINAKIMPNPANNVLQVEAEENINKIEIYNLAGQLQLVIDNAGNTKKQMINITELTQGMYIVYLTTAHGKAAARIIKQ